MVRGPLVFVLLVGCAAPTQQADASYFSVPDAAQLTDASVVTVDVGADAARVPGDGGVDAAPACDLVPQSGCAASEACRLEAVHVACGPTTSQPAEYASCSSTTSCAAGLQCLGGDSNTLCRRFCRDGVTDCGTGRTCVHPSSMQLDAAGAFISLPVGVGICGSM